MLLCFKSLDHDGHLTRFQEKITSGEKKHTLRYDGEFRWWPGRKIHMWEENPRNTSMDPEPIILPFRRAKLWWFRDYGTVEVSVVDGKTVFRKTIVEHCKMWPVAGEFIEDISSLVNPYHGTLHPIAVPLVYACEQVKMWDLKSDYPQVSIGLKQLSPGEIAILAQNDGLTVDDFFEWFRRSMRKDEKSTGIVQRKLIHWTDETIYGERRRVMTGYNHNAQ